MLVVIGAVSITLAIATLPAFAAMTVAGLAGALAVGRPQKPAKSEISSETFRNPFSIGPALTFGVVFAIVMLITRAARESFGNRGLTVVSAVSGLVDVDAISLTLAGFVNSKALLPRDAVIGLILAAGANAVFKSAVTLSSRQPSFYLRVIAGFLLALAVGVAVLVLIDPGQFADSVSRYLKR
jgi:uncharacterized membrane protein (DUF4010 family)